MKVTTLTIIFSLLIISTIGQGIKDIEIIPNIVYHQKDGNALTMDLYIPSNSNGKGVVFINSGGFQSPFFPNSIKKELKVYQILLKIDTFLFLNLISNPNTLNNLVSKN